MSDLSAKSFLGLVQKSGVVPEDRLKQALAELSKLAAGKPVHLDQLTQFMIAEGLITKWQYEKLLTRKFKGFFLGQYKLLSLLGTGGMSTVYLAQHTLSGQQRAIKVLPRTRVNDKSYLDRFLREGRAAASLNHPNIVRIYDLANDEDVYYMVMEYVPGMDLHQKVQEQGPAKVEDALRYLEQAAEGLAHAHARNIVHRDIKPANLLLTTEGTIKILDLGLALVSEGQESLTLLHNEKVMGTADYLAPEQAVDSHNVDPRADIYSLGCTFYFLLTGQPPFPEGTIAQRIAMHQSREPKSPRELRPDCPPLVEALCLKLMKKSPGDRIQSCERLVQAIQKCRVALREASAPAGGAAEVAAPAPSAAVPPKAAAATLPTPPAPPPAPRAKIPAAPAGRPVVSVPGKPSVPAAPAVSAPAAQKESGARPPAAGAPAKPVARPVAKPSPVAASQEAAAKPVVKPHSPGSPVISVDGPKVDEPLVAPAVADLVVPATRSRKKARATALRANLLIAGIVLFCFVVLVGLMIFLAQIFGK